MRISDRQMRPTLNQVRNWAQSKIRTGNEPPWAWYQYMKLIETADAILDGMDAVSPTVNLRSVEAHQESDLPPKGSTTEQDKPPHDPAVRRVRMPI